MSIFSHFPPIFVPYSSHFPQPHTSRHNHPQPTSRVLCLLFPSFLPISPHSPSFYPIPLHFPAFSPFPPFLPHSVGGFGGRNRRCLGNGWWGFRCGRNATWGHKAQATNHKTLYYFFFNEFCTLVELLSDTGHFLNVHFFEGNLRHFWENLHQFTQGGGRGPKAL